MKKTASVIVLLLFSIYVDAQKLLDLDLEEQLSSIFTYSILESRSGLVYFGLHEGLNRYDGTKVKIYENDPYDSFSISSQAVIHLHEDFRGYIWLVTYDGSLDVFDPIKQRFHHFGVLGGKTRIETRGITALTTDEKGNVWLADNEGMVSKISFQKALELGEMPAYIGTDFYTKKIISIPKNQRTDSSGNDEIHWHASNLKVRGDYIWGLTTDDQLFKIDIDKEELTIEYATRKTEWDFNGFSQTKNGNLYCSTDVVFIEITADDKVNIIKEKGLKTARLLFLRNEKDFLAIKKKEGSLASLWEELWSIPFENGSLNFDSKKVLIRGEEWQNPKGYSSSSGLAWIRHGAGLFQIKDSNVKFEHLLEGGSLYNIEKKGKHLYLRYGTIWRYDLETKVFKPLKGNTELSDRAISRIAFDSSGGTWFVENYLDGKKATKTFQLAYMDSTGTSKRYVDIPLGFIRDVQLCIDGQDRLWLIGVGGSIFCVSKTDFSTKHFHDSDIDTLLETKFSHTAYYEDVDGQMWLGTDRGAIRTNSKGFPREKAKFELFQNDPKDRNSLSGNLVKSFHSDPFEAKKYIWIGTSRGLNRLDKTTGDFVYYTRSNSDLPDNMVYQIRSDNKGYLWLSTNKGLSRFDIKNETFRNFKVEDGLQNKEFNSYSSYKDEEGYLYFGGINGLNRFHPDSLDAGKNEFDPNLMIVGLRVNGKEIRLRDDSTPPILKKTIEHTERITLNHDQNTLGLTFIALDFNDIENNQYKYRLIEKGWRKNKGTTWFELGNQNEVQLTNLDPGAYRFEVTGTNHDGVWSSKIAHLNLVIRPPWWRTNWAYILYVSFVLGLAYLFYKNQIRRARLKDDLLFKEKEALRLVEMDELKSNFFSNITHEFRTPLTLILEPARQLLQKQFDRKTMQSLSLMKNNSERLLLLVNQLLDISKLEAEKMEIDLRKGDLPSILHGIFYSFETIANRNGVRLDFELEEEIEDFYFDKNHIEKVFYNLISNAIKFTPKGSINVALKEEKESIVIRVSDTGLGIPESALATIFERFRQVDGSSTRVQEGTGIGLSLTKELTELMGGRVEVESELGKGTCFSIFIPKILEDEKGLVWNKEERTTLPKAVLATTEKTTREQAGETKEKLLLIEDNAELRYFIGETLSPYYEVTEAVDGEDGIKKALEEIPDIVVSDLMMPKKNGFEVVEALKNDMKTSHIPIVLLTAKTAIDSKLKGLKGGADDYLTKPFNTQELLIRIENLIEIRKRLQTKYSNQGQRPFSKEKEHENLSPLDRVFFEKLTDFMEKGIDDSSLTIEQMASALFMSHSQLLRKTKALVGQTPRVFFRNYRLDRAKTLLENEQKSVAQVALAVGFKDEKYFSAAFKKRFGQSPSVFLS